VIGRSLVIGRPVVMMLMQKNGTVTICHTKTKNVTEVVKEADIVVVAAGVAASVGADSLRPGQVVIDVGIHVNDDGKLIGDVIFDEAERIVGAITPVPGGVGTVTTSVSVRHVIEAAKASVK
jgi:methylenetetrahydrofolate dehydrogenase (NADP+)/methenyltetrahydrofolate cyclohydrolase